MRIPLTITAGDRSYTIQGEENDVYSLFSRFVRETMEPVEVPTIAVPEAPAVEEVTETAAEEEEPVAVKEDIYSREYLENIPFSKLEKLREEWNCTQQTRDMKRGLANIEVLMKSYEALRNKPNGNAADDKPAVEEVTPASKVAAIKSRFERRDKDGNPIPNPKYTGFLLIKCEKCGEVKAYNAKKEADKYICNNCKHETKFTDMVPLTAICECGNRWRYFTNLTEDSFEISCIHCGSPIPVFYNDKLTKYETLYEDTNNHKKKGAKKNQKRGKSAVNKKNVKESTEGAEEVKEPEAVNEENKKED